MINSIEAQKTLAKFNRHDKNFEYNGYKENIPQHNKDHI